ncbi:MAG: ROK family protein [Candidatus Gribaldobacteria bacterium]|nr:ROK family protein [Candidatus Gribaldobacteria bacterium]
MKRVSGIKPIDNLVVPELLYGKRLSFEGGGSGVRAIVVQDGILQKDSIYRIKPVSWEELSEWVGWIDEKEKPICKDITTAGVFSQDGVVIESPNLEWLKGHNLCELFRSFCNDLIGAVTGEMYCDEGIIKGISNGVFETIGFGWGGVNIREGVIYKSEPGHKFAGPGLADVPCGCKRDGCKEGVYSGGGVAKQVIAMAYHYFGIKPDSEGNINGLDPCQWLDTEARAGREWALEYYLWLAEGIGHTWADILNGSESIEIVGFMGSFITFGMEFMKETILNTMLKQAMFPVHREALEQQIQTGEETILIRSKLWNKECPGNSFMGAAIYGELSYQGLI